jgi:hypothetical protein
MVTYESVNMLFLKLLYELAIETCTPHPEC